MGRIASLTRLLSPCPFPAKLFGVICWRMGLSHRGTSRMLSGLNILLSPMSVWQDAQGQAKKIEKQNDWRWVRALGLDGAVNPVGRSASRAGDCGFGVLFQDSISPLASPITSCLTYHWLHTHDTAPPVKPRKIITKWLQEKCCLTQNFPDPLRGRSAWWISGNRWRYNVGK